MPAARVFTWHVDLPSVIGWLEQPGIVAPLIENCIVPPSGLGDVVAENVIVSWPPAGLLPEARAVVVLGVTDSFKIDDVEGRYPGLPEKLAVIE